MRKAVENWSEMSKMTLWRWLERIEKARRISSLSDMIKWHPTCVCVGGDPHIIAERVTFLSSKKKAD